MSNSIRLVLALHNHQPVGNLDEVIERAYQDSYRPFLDVFARYPSLKISLHTSGSLWDWLVDRHPEYIDQLAGLSAEGRIEILGGAYYEPILPMIPSRDRRGQIKSFGATLARRFGQAPLGMWLPERVWEQGLAGDLAAAGIEHTLLDDFHFKNAGIADEELFGYYLTESQGRLIAVFPGSERLRYLIPFAPPEQTIDYLRRAAAGHPGGVVVFGDDGEKFGTWPGMREHVYGRNWLVRFFDLLVDNASWLHLGTLGEAVNQLSPKGTVYLPDAGYREMSAWSSLADRYGASPAKNEAAARGSWHNFRVKYPEAGEMYARMTSLSKRIARSRSAAPAKLAAARTALYRAQCNCAYWHGTFGGIYLPHLRQAVDRHLIVGEKLLVEAESSRRRQAEARIADLNFDVHKEVSLANEHLVARISPEAGGRLYGLDVRRIEHNLLATLARRPEPYHADLLDRSQTDRSEAPEGDLAQYLQYDAHGRHTLVDHFYTSSTALDDVAGGLAHELGDFAAGRYEARLRRRDGAVQLELSREGLAAGHSIRLTKTITLTADSPTLKVVYRLDRLPARHTLHLAVECNFAGIAAEKPNRYLHDGKRKQLATVGSTLDLSGRRGLYLFDEQLGFDAGLRVSRPSHFWAFPVVTVSRSERGLERIHQSMVLMPHWHVQADASGSWSVTLELPIDTSLAESRLSTDSPDLAGRSRPPARRRRPNGGLSMAA